MESVVSKDIFFILRYGVLISENGDQWTVVGVLLGYRYPGHKALALCSVCLYTIK